MRRIYLLRHAKSSWDDPALGDFDRPLNGRGRKNARQMGKHLAQAGIRPAMILCSAALRTRATYEILESRLEGVPVSFEDGLYEAARHDLLDRLHRLDPHLPSVMLIGHNPGLERLAAYLTGGHGEPEAVVRLSEKFPTGSLAVLDAEIEHWAELGQGTCRLTDFVRPRDLGEE